MVRKTNKMFNCSYKQLITSYSLVGEGEGEGVCVTDYVKKNSDLNSRTLHFVLYCVL